MTHEPRDPSDTPAARAEAHLRAAVAAIDAVFGEGHARDNPALVAHVVQAAAIESAVLSGETTGARAMETARQVSRETNETILKLKPRLFG